MSYSIQIRPAVPGALLSMKRGGFTLIEVLVVVAIIALLVAILIPSLARARENAISATCLSSHHQIGVAVRLYAHQNQGVLPQQISTMIEWVVEPTRKALEKELGRNNYHKVLFCPNDDITRDGNVEKKWPPAHLYGTVAYRIGYYYLGNPTWEDPVRSNPQPWLPDQLWIDMNHNGQIRDEYACKIDEKGADRVVIMTCRIIPQGPRENWKFRHPFDSKTGWSNVVCGDGHAERRPYYKAKVRWYAPNPVGW